MEVDTCGLEVAVLEVVEVEHDVRLIHFRLRVALREVESLCSFNLDARELGYCAAQQSALFVGIVAAALAPVLQLVEE